MNYRLPPNTDYVKESTFDLWFKTKADAGDDLGVPVKSLFDPWFKNKIAIGDDLGIIYKDTYQIIDFCPFIPNTTGLVSNKGLAIGASGAEGFSYIRILKGIYTLEHVDIAFVNATGVITSDITMYIFGAVAGIAYGTIVAGTKRSLVEASTDSLSFHSLDSYIGNINTKDNITIRLAYQSTAPATNSYIQGVRLTYSIT